MTLFDLKERRLLFEESNAMGACDRMLDTVDQTRVLCLLFTRFCGTGMESKAAVVDRLILPQYCLLISTTRTCVIVCSLQNREQIISSQSLFRRDETSLNFKRPVRTIETRPREFKRLHRDTKTAPSTLLIITRLHNII